MATTTNTWKNALINTTTEASQTIGPLFMIFGLAVIGMAYHPSVVAESSELYLTVSRFAFLIMAGGLITIYGFREKFEA